MGVQEPQGVEDGKPVVSEPKTAKSRREVYLSEIAIQALRSHHGRQLEARIDAYSYNSTSEGAVPSIAAE